MRAQITLNTGQRLALEGFMAVSRERMKKLPGETLAALAKTDELELLYMHVQSMRNFRAMLERVAPGQTTTKTAAPGTPGAAEDRGGEAKKGEASQGPSGKKRGEKSTH
jgi:hypothetical protein